MWRSARWRSTARRTPVRPIWPVRVGRVERDERVGRWGCVGGAGCACDGHICQNGDVTDWVWERARAYTTHPRALTNEKIPRHARLSLLRAATLPRLNYLLRTHAPQELKDSAARFDDRVAHTLSLLVASGPLTGAASVIAKLPLAMGGFGLRSQRAIADFAAASVQKKGAQQAPTRAADRRNLELLQSIPSGPELEIVKANAAPGATHALMDPSIVLGDVAFEVLAHQRLLIRVLRLDFRCTCGADTDNAHINVCPPLPGRPRRKCHNYAPMAIEAWATRLGLSAKTGPRAGATANPLQQAHAAKKRKRIGWATGKSTVSLSAPHESTGGPPQGEFPVHARGGAVRPSLPFYAAALHGLLPPCVAKAMRERGALGFLLTILLFPYLPPPCHTSSLPQSNAHKHTHTHTGAPTAKLQRTLARGCRYLPQRFFQPESIKEAPLLRYIHPQALRGLALGCAVAVRQGAALQAQPTARRHGRGAATENATGRHGGGAHSRADASGRNQKGTGQSRTASLSSPRLGVLGHVQRAWPLARNHLRWTRWESFESLLGQSRRS
ncbi:hypothetical protein NESM_000760500 [Novymonas esmeraldas]|uniref:Uncharacterized protein n=1 Tax=Novymonas esmeraldas TaxID=1808958 RepID=A0AAW0EX84_9TRYP